MAPLTKRRWSTRRQGKRRASIKARNISADKCSNCGQLKPVASACPKCGFYRGKQIVTIKQKKNKEKPSPEKEG